MTGSSLPVRGLGVVARFAVAIVVGAAVVGYSTRAAIGDRTGAVVPVALAVLVLVVAASTGLPDARSVGRTARIASVAIAAPAVLLPGVAWLASKLLDGTSADGMLALGLAPAEIASVATVSIAGGDAVLAAATLAGSILVTTIAGPIALRFLVGGNAGLDVLPLIIGLALEVVVPFAIGIVAGPRLRRRIETDAFDGLAVLLVGLLAALTASQLPAVRELPPLFAAAALLVLGGYAIGITIGRFLTSPERTSSWLTSGMRDFAVGAALATAAFGPAAAAPAAAYGVLVLLSGTGVAVLRRRTAIPRPPAAS